ncbi:MAG: GNAT family N-acetyltransferase [Oscillospiraceae bacterium]|nr:GNAT family N-acetyltransferase [Oscillospiraceae bacterium]
MEIEYFSETRDDSDIIDLYKALKWYKLTGYTDEDIERANRNSFYSVYAYDGYKLVGLGRVASDGFTAAVMSGICVRPDYRRRGIGEQIVTRLVYHCQSGGNKLSVQLFCEDSLIPWYTKQGFVPHNRGMWKEMVLPEDKSRLRRNFRDVYGIEQISDLLPDFYWYNFDAFGDFRYYGAMNSRGEMVPCIYMTLYCEEQKCFSADIIFENVQQFEIGCKGIKTPLSGFDIMKVNKESLDGMKYRICSLEDDDINFFCESFRIINVNCEQT